MIACSDMSSCTPLVGGGRCLFIRIGVLCCTCYYSAPLSSTVREGVCTCYYSAPYMWQKKTANPFHKLTNNTVRVCVCECVCVCVLCACLCVYVSVCVNVCVVRVCVCECVCCVCACLCV